MQSSLEESNPVLRHEHSSPENFSTHPQSIPRSKGRPKGSKKMKRTVLNYGPDPIGQRTRSKIAKGNFVEDGDFLMPVVNSAFILSCSAMISEHETKLAVSFLKHWTFRNKCELPSCQNSCVFDNNSECIEHSTAKNQGCLRKQRWKK